MSKLILSDAALLGMFAAQKGDLQDPGAKKQEPALLLIRLEGVTLPSDFEMIPTEPPVEVNFGEVDRLNERNRKMIDELEQNLSRTNRALRKVREQVNLARSTGRIVKEFKAAS